MSALTRNEPILKIPLRIVLIVPFVLQVVLVAGLVGYLSFRNGQQAVNNVAHRLRDEVTARIEEHLHTFLDTPHRINQINAGLLHQGLLDAGDQNILERYFWEQIQLFGSVTSIYFGNTEGGLTVGGREGAEGSLYVIVTDGFISGPFCKYATDDQGNRTNLLVTVPDFDARTRPWYVRAVEKGGATWSDVYILFTGQDMAVAASRPVYDELHRLLGVVSVDIFLSHLGNFLKTLQIGETGQSFIIERSGLLIASSADEKPFTDRIENSAQRRLYANESTLPIIRRTAEFLTKRLGDYRNIAHKQHFEFETEGCLQFLQVSPVQDEYGIDWLVAVVVSESDFMAQINANSRATVFLIAAALIIAVVVGIITAQWITKPILHLNASAQALARGEWDRTVTADRIGEIGELTQSFNHMGRQLNQTLESLTSEISERRQAEEALRESNHRLEGALAELKEAQDKMVQQERLAAVGQLAAGIAHDFNNILTSILGYAELLQVVPHTPEAMQANLARIATSGQRAAHLVRQILDFSRKSIRQSQQLDLVSYLREVFKFLECTIPESIHLSMEVGDGHYLIQADPTQMHQMITNLAVNARDAMPNGGNLRIVLSRENVSDKELCTGCNQRIRGEWVHLRVSDTGTGIFPEVLPHIFEPFFTTKAVGEGTGLGLSQVYGIIKQHAGHIVVDSRPGHGTTFDIYLPPLTSAQNRIESEEMIPVFRGQGEILLLVEDDEIALEVSKSMLECLGYRVLNAANGKEALSLYREHRDEIALVLSDMVMPDMEGMALYSILKVQNPEVKVIMMSGYPLDEKGAKLLEQGIVNWFQKPISFQTLSRLISGALLRNKNDENANP